MLFVLIGHFKQGVEQRHKELRESYNEHLAQRRPRVKIAGPLRSGGREAGVFVLIDAKDEAEAQAFGRESPYGPLYERIDIFEFNAEVGRID